MTERFVETSGSGSVSTAPDRAVLTVGAEHSAGDVAGALAGCRDALVAMLDAARAAGCGAADLRTTGLRVNPDWRDGQPSGYLAGQELTVRLAQTVPVGPLITALAAAAGDAFRMQGLTWSVAEPASLLVEARRLAFEDARARAAHLATLGGCTLGAVLQIVEGGGGGHEWAPMRLTKASGDLPVEGGTDEVSASVMVKWELRGPAE